MDDVRLPCLPVGVILWTAERGRVSESNTDSGVRVRRGRASNGESSGSVASTGLSYSMVYDFTVDLRGRERERILLI